MQITAIRQTAAVNHLKWLALGDAHVPGEAQAERMLGLSAEMGLSRNMDPRTWRSWFREQPSQASGSCREWLDRCGERLSWVGREHLTAHGGDFYQQLIGGGLLDGVSGSLGSKKWRASLWSHVSQYQPMSSLHLHMDALEIAGLSESSGLEHWLPLKAMALKRMLEVLWQRWELCSGHQYGALSSDLQLQMRNATAEEQASLQEDWGHFQPSLFNIMLKRAPRPSWEDMDDCYDLSPEHVHRLLLAIAADTDFLQHDRLESWAVDLATTVLLLHCACNLPEGFGDDTFVRAAPLYLAELETCFFDPEDETVLQESLMRLQTLGHFEWTVGSHLRFLQAREFYESWMSSLGVPGSVVADVMSRGYLSKRLQCGKGFGRSDLALSSHH